MPSRSPSDTTALVGQAIDMKSRPLFNYSPRLKPLPHQVEAITFLSQRDWAALFDEQGLGKTKIIIDTMLRGFAQGVIESAVVICKKSLLATWQEEIVKHSQLRSVVLRGSQEQKGLHYMWFAHFYLINYDLVSSEVERLKRFLLTRPVAIILDESQRIKNPESKAARAIHSIAALAKKRFIITGTPIANSPGDLWAQVFFLDGGLTLGHSPEEFYKRFEIKERPHKEPVIDETGLEKLREALSGFSMRRLKENVLQLPEKTYKTIEVELEPHQREMYDSLRQQLFLEIQNQDGQTVIDDAENILKRMLRLVEIASNPALLDTAYCPVPAKFHALDELIQDVVTRGEKAIIWTCFVKNIRLLRRRYDRFGAAMLFGDIPIEDRSRIVNSFQHQHDLRVLIANPAAAKEGLTLTAANHAIYLDRNFNLLDYLQSQDRIHRISQERPAFIYNLVGEQTIDAYIDDVVYRKQVVAQYVYGDTTDLQMPPVVFTKEDILRLLGA